MNQHYNLHWEHCLLPPVEIPRPHGYYIGLKHLLSQRINGPRRMHAAKSEFRRNRTMCPSAFLYGELVDRAGAYSTLLAVRHNSKASAQNISWVVHTTIIFCGDKRRRQRQASLALKKRAYRTSSLLLSIPAAVRRPLPTVLLRTRPDLPDWLRQLLPLG